MSLLSEGYALGLDLGTTFSCIGVYRNGGVEIIPNRNGEKITPSIVTILDEDNILKGEETEGNLVQDYENSIYATKRFIGRDIQDKEVQKELKKINFPYKIINDKKTKNPVIEINIKNKKLYFSLEQIASFIIKKMVQNAEDYLNKKVKKLVITIPANFNDSQRKSTIEAAKLAGIEVLRIINEPTAAALAYGLQEKKNLNKDQKILIFDLGGGTFDITILNIIKDQNNNQYFDVLSTSSNKFLGGEDFDQKLVEYVLNRFCEETEESIDKIKQNRKAIKRLKISCEKIKRVLSIENDTTLCINNFYNGKDILMDISKSKFEELCKDLFDKLEKPIEDALEQAKKKSGNKEEIQIGEIILVGGSTRIPKIKSLLKKKFNCTINDLINPDETVAYGATLMAAKILIKKDNLLLGFNLMDITPLSLGVEVINESEDEEIKKEGGRMSVIIKRGESIPCTKIRNYITVEDNQESVPIVIYEGENTYVKYNHILKKVELAGLTKKPKGKVNIKVKFFIDANGILTVTGTEDEKGKNNSIEVKIKDDMVKLSDEKIENLRKENEKYYKKRKNDKKLDYGNLKETLKEFQDAYKECDDDEEKFSILINYSNTLEEFIGLFDKNFDNETMIEKFYIYIKELLISYEKILNMEEIKNNEEIQKNIIIKTKDYINEFISKSSGYLKNLVETIKTFPKAIFYEIIIFIMEKFNYYGKNYLKKPEKYCKYNSLKCFEKAKWYFDIYIEKIYNVTAICDKEIANNCKLQSETSVVYIKDINSGAILLSNESLKSGTLIPSGTGFTVNRKGLTFGNKEEKEKNKIVLQNYEQLYAECQIKKEMKNILPEEKERIMKEEAICLANIIKINHKLLGNTNYKTYCELAEKCLFITDKLNIDENEEWFKEFKEIYEEIKDLNERIETINETKSRIINNNKEQFNEIDEKFNNSKRNRNQFFQYILETTPYDGYEEDKKNNILSKKNEAEIINYLSEKYHPNRYSFTDNPNIQLRFCKIEYIDSLINSLKKS